MKLQNDIIRLVFLGFPLLLRLPSGNKVPRLRDQNYKNLIFCYLTLVPRPRDDNEGCETKITLARRIAWIAASG
jgi:hypothetical protein